MAKRQKFNLTASSDQKPRAPSKNSDTRNINCGRKPMDKKTKEMNAQS